MFHDFHIIDSEKSAYIFFPETFKLYAVSKEDGNALKLYLKEGASIRSELEAILINEKKAIVNLHPQNTETDCLCLYMAHDCNLSCTYCYNNGGHSVNPSMMMPENVVEAAFRRFFTKHGKNYAVSFYGGEPLLNFKTIKRAVEIGDALESERGIKITYSMTTNGTILTKEMEDFIKRHISNVTISIDGEKAVHDLHRKGAWGSLYEKVTQNLKRLSGGNCRVTLQATVSGDTVSHLGETVSHLSTLHSDGFSVSPVNIGSTNPAYISDERFEEFVNRFVGLTKRRFYEIIDGTGQGFKYTFNIVFNLLTKRRFIRHCDAGKNPAITADGSLYACHGLIRYSDFYMGNIREGLDQSFWKVREIFAGLTVHGIEECKVCWARYLCGGSCYSHAYFNTGTLYKPEPRHCILFRRNAEVVIGEFLKAIEDPIKRNRLYKSIKKAVGVRRGDGCGK